MKPAFLFLISAVASAAPCTTTEPNCTEWVALAGGPSRALIYRTYSLDAKNEQIIRAPTVVHGQGCDADNYFRTSLAAAFLAGDQLKKQLAARPVTYLLGEIDILPSGGFDNSCPAMAQGTHASGARPGVWRIRQPEIRRPPPHRRGSALRPQRALYVHRRAGAAHSIPEVVVIFGVARCFSRQRSYNSPLPSDRIA